MIKDLLGGLNNESEESLVTVRDLWEFAHISIMRKARRVLVFA